MRELKAVKTGPCAVRIDTGKIPAFIRENLAQAAFIAIARAYQDPETQKEYQRWKAERASAGGGHV